jgi:hypothetical protein
VALVRYTEAGFLVIDNNAAEREMKQAAIGRNYAEPLIMRSRCPIAAQCLQMLASDSA